MKGEAAFSVRQITYVIIGELARFERLGVRNSLQFVFSQRLFLFYFDLFFFILLFTIDRAGHSIFKD